LSKNKAKKLLEIISEKDEREKTVQGKIVLKSDSESGVSDIKEVLNIENVDIRYIGSSQFSISVKGKDFKEANSNLVVVMEELEKNAGKKKVFFEIVREK